MGKTFACALKLGDILSSILGGAGHLLVIKEGQNISLRDRMDETSACDFRIGWTLACNLKLVETMACDQEWLEHWLP